MLTDYLLFTIPTFGLLLLSAIFGLRYLKKNKTDKAIHLFVYFLCFTVLVEIVGSYTAIRYLTNNEWFGFTLGTSFERNLWLYNAYSIISFVVYIQFFRLQLRSNTNRSIIAFLLIAFVFGSVLNLVYSGVYLKGFSAFTNVTGSLILLLAIAIYYYQLLTSDAILEIKRSIIFYISIGAIILHIALTPILIYSIYYNRNNGYDEFLTMFRIVLFSTNVLVYLIYTAGFILCRNKKSS